MALTISRLGEIGQGTEIQEEEEEEEEEEDEEEEEEEVKSEYSIVYDSDMKYGH